MNYKTFKNIVNDNNSKDKEKIKDYLFLNHHLSFEDSKRWLKMNGDTKISTSYSCPDCGVHTQYQRDEHICATELVSASECGTMDGALFLEKLKCSSCNEVYIIENGV